MSERYSIDYATGKLDLDLDDEVPRSALADCLDSGWTADEIAEELGLEGASAVVSWCLYHDLPLPKAAAAAKAPQVPASQPPAPQDPAPKRPKRAATPKPRPAPTCHLPKPKGAQSDAQRQRKRRSDTRVVAAYAKQGSLSATARELGLTLYAVKQALMRRGVAWTTTDKPTSAERERQRLLAIAHAALVAAGATPQDIASILRPGSGEIATALRAAKTQDTP